MDSDQITLSRDLSAFINQLTFLGKNLDEKVTVSLAISLFAGKQVSVARAAELAKKSLPDFMEILQRGNIPWCEYTDDMKKSDDTAVKLILRESENET